MKLYLARHAETNYNIAKLANADPNIDVHFTEHGIEQAENLAELLKDVDYDIVYISELPRTRQTAEIINKHHDKELIVDGRINDNKTGFESRPVNEWLQALDASDDRWSAKFRDGESLNEAAERGHEFIDYIKTLGHQAVLVVTHGYMTQVIFGYIENKTLQEASEFNLLQGTYAEFEI